MTLAGHFFVQTMFFHDFSHTFLRKSMNKDQPHQFISTFFGPNKSLTQKLDLKLLLTSLEVTAGLGVSAGLLETSMAWLVLPSTGEKCWTNSWTSFKWRFGMKNIAHTRKRLNHASLIKILYGLQGLDKVEMGSSFCISYFGEYSGPWEELLHHILNYQSEPNTSKLNYSQIIATITSFRCALAIRVGYGLWCQLDPSFWLSSSTR